MQRPSDSVDRLASSALRGIAADPLMRECFALSAKLRDVLAVPASRYVLGSTIDEMAPKLQVLSDRGYRLGVEYVGEEISDRVKINHVVDEYMTFLALSEREPYACNMQIGFDLSNVGLLLSRETAIENTRLIARAAEKRNVSVMISMERSTFTEAILSIFTELAPACPKLGLMIQAQLHRSESDARRLSSYGNKIRLVKGVYKECSEVLLERSEKLNERYVRIASQLAQSRVPFAVATHDSAILNALIDRNILESADEVEMLHGCNASELRRIKSSGYPCRISGVYGEDFFLHFLHRLAEHTPNITDAVADFGNPSRIVFGSDY